MLPYFFGFDPKKEAPIMLGGAWVTFGVLVFLLLLVVEDFTVKTKVPHCDGTFLNKQEGNSAGILIKLFSKVQPPCIIKYSYDRSLKPL